MKDSGEEESKIKEFEERKPTTKMSSAGLVYKHYGKEIIKNMAKQFYDRDLNQTEIDHVF